MHSSPHRTHLLAQSAFYRDQTNFGVGFYSDPASPFRHYWVIITAPPPRNMAAASSRGVKAVRISVADPSWMEDEDVTAPRPTAVKLPNAPGRLWNWDDSAEPDRVSAPRPRGES
jgi:hypothetical protein